jgi:hypothetical protein
MASPRKDTEDIIASIRIAAEAFVQGSFQGALLKASAKNWPYSGRSALSMATIPVTGTPFRSAIIQI